MSIENPGNSRIRKQAIQWLIAKNAGAWSSSDQQALDDWLAKCVENQQQYQQMQQIWASMDTLKDQDFPQRQAALDYRPPNTPRNLVHFPGVNVRAIKAGQHVNPPLDTNQKPLLRAQWLKTGLAVAASIVMLLGIQTYRQTGVKHYQTAKGEQQTIFLADGSQIVLNTDSELTVELQLFHRQVELAHGEALFNVAHNPIRPFQVLAGGGRIRDIGTRFDVYTQANQVTVAVLEGDVEILTADQGKAYALAAEQAASYDSQGKLKRLSMPNPQAVTAWEQGKLIFAEQSLDEVLTQIARYHPVEFQIADPRLREMKISGAFNTANLALFLETLEMSFPVKAQIIDAQHVHIQRLSRQ